MEMPSPKDLSPVDRERILWTAGGQFMRGEISSEQYREIRRVYDIDLIETVLTLAKRQLRREFLEKLRIFKFPRP